MGPTECLVWLSFEENAEAVQPHELVPFQMSRKVLLTHICSRHQPPDPCLTISHRGGGSSSHNWGIRVRVQVEIGLLR